ncbi:hypothetical protein CRM22_002234, partial [Opisthorchis felineus]
VQSGSVNRLDNNTSIPQYLASELFSLSRVVRASNAQGALFNFESGPEDVG